MFLFLKRTLLNRVLNQLEYGNFENALDLISWYDRLFRHDSYSGLVLCFIFTDKQFRSLFYRQLRIVYKYWAGKPNYFNLKASYYFKNGFFDRAIENMDKAIFLMPKEAINFNNRGYYKLKTLDFQGAIIDFNKAIELNPNSYFAYNNRAFANIKLGDEKSIHDINFSIKNYPNNANALKNKALWELTFGDKTKIHKILKGVEKKKFYFEVKEEIEQILLSVK